MSAKYDDHSPVFAERERGPRGLDADSHAYAPTEPMPLAHGWEPTQPAALMPHFEPTMPAPLSRR